jgi:hypothetical protein
VSQFDSVCRLEQFLTRADLSGGVFSLAQQGLDAFALKVIFLPVCVTTEAAF